MAQTKNGKEKVGMLTEGMKIENHSAPYKDYATVDGYINAIYEKIIYECFGVFAETILHHIFDVLDDRGILIEIITEATERYKEASKAFRESHYNENTNRHRSR